MLLGEIENLLKNGETETVEFKSSFDREVIETAVAFANAKGGTILIGVDDKGNIVGVSLGKETLKNWPNEISQSTEPTVIPEISSEQVKGKSIVIISIPEYPLKPVATRGRCFKRIGNSNKTMTPQEIAQMHLHTRGMSWDALLAGDATIDDIDFEKVRRYIRNANATGRRKIEENEDYLKVLEKLELIKDGKPTWATILLFGKKPQSPLFQAQIHCGRFKVEMVVIDDRMIDGTIIEQVDETMAFILKNISVKFVMTGKPAREEIWDYPLNALREAVINAVCHRDYTISSHIQIRIYDDKLMVWSPGDLPFGITLEDLFKPHSSVLRNKKIAGIFYDMGWIEQWGSGIDKMRKACKNVALPEPVFEEYQGFRVTFSKDIYTEDYLQNLGLNERQIKAVMYVKEKGNITNKEYRVLTGTSKAMATIDLKNLVDKKIFVKRGTTGRGTDYVLSKQTTDNGLKGLKNG